MASSRRASLAQSALRLALVACALVSSACVSVPGECDVEASRRVVYTSEGRPAYEGQALIISSCGYGTFCHAGAAEGELRHGAPRGLNFDIEPASFGPEVGEVDRLRRNQRTTFGQRTAIWGEVVHGAMPPGGAAGSVLESELRPRYSAVGGMPLPEIDTAQGREVLRNWISCGLPVIERTEAREDGLPPEVGAVVGTVCLETANCAFTSTSRCDAETNTCVPCESDADCTHLPGTPLCSSEQCVRPIEPTWASIHEIVVTPTCAVETCHGEDSTDTDLDLRGAAESYARLGEVSASEDCGALGLPLVSPGDPEASLFYRKIFTTTGDEAICGFRMPYAADALPDQWIETIAAWITSGAAGP